MELKKIENTNIYEFTSTGRLSEKDAKKLSQAFTEFKNNGEKIKLLGIIEKAPFPLEFSAIDDLVRLKLNSISVVEKYAIVSDKEWVENIVPIANFFTPSLPMKTFENDERTEAIAWLQEETVKEYNPEDYLSSVVIKKVASNNFEINIPHKKINHAAMTAIYNIINEKEKNEKLNILVVFESFPSFDSFKTLVEGLKIDLKVMGKIKKYAIVSDEKWTETYTKIGDFLTPGLDMKFFPMAKLEEARHWTFN